MKITKYCNSSNLYSGLLGFLVGIVLTLALFWLIYSTYNKESSPENAIQPFPFQILESVVNKNKLPVPGEKK